LKLFQNDNIKNGRIVKTVIGSRLSTLVNVLVN